MPQRMESKGSTDLDTLQVSMLMSYDWTSCSAVGRIAAEHATLKQ